MKRLLTLTLLGATVFFAAPSAEAKTVDKLSAFTPQFYQQDRDRRRRNDDWNDRNRRNRRDDDRESRDRRRNDRRYDDRRDNDRRNWNGARTYYESRYVRYGWRVYRETYRVKYLPNGRVKTKLVSRVRVR